MSTPMKRLSPRVLALVTALLALVAAGCAQFADLPELTAEDLLPPELAQSSKLYAGNGQLITTLHEEQNRTIVPLSKVPEHVQEAVIAIEDQRFYEHDGVDVRAVLRAIVANASSGEIREGGSTLTQQYVKNIIISPGETAPKTIERKINEAALARQLEAKLSKNEILERYLNTIYFGQGAYGIEAAAKTYFGKPARKLSLAQGAMLAGIIRVPEEYDPYKNPKVAKERRNLVLERMGAQGYATPEEVTRAQASKLRLQKVAVKDEYPAPYFVDYVQRLITYHPSFKAIGKTVAQRTQALFKGGLRIYTTVDLDMQAAADAAWREMLPYKSDPHASLVAIDPTTGAVKAMVGGRDWFARPKEDPYAKLNLAILAKPDLGCVRVGKKCEDRAPGSGRHAGSAFKAFALAAAIDNGVSLARSYKAPSQIVIPGADAGRDYTVRNYEGGSFGSNLSVLEATVNSVNVVYAQMIDDIGAAEVGETASAMGITTPICSTCLSSALGAVETNPFDMASAYGTFATNGEHNPPYGIERIVDAGGKVLYDASKDPELEPEQAIEPAVAYLTTTALEQVIIRGTGTNAQIGRPAAGKTGTSQEYRDAWFAGYTPTLAAAVWVGYPENQIEMKASCAGSTELCRETRTVTSIGVTGGSWPAMIWQRFMLQALSGVPADAFDKPAIGFETKVIDIRYGDCLAGKFTPEEFKETATFAKGTGPDEECRLEGKGRPVPDVFGFPADKAIEVIQDAGYAVETIEEYSTTYPPGTIIGQDPAAGQKAPLGTTVVLVVSTSDRSAGGGNGRGNGGSGGNDNASTVPDVLGMSREAAVERLNDAGYEVDTIIERESSRGRAKNNRNRVWKQSPAGGTSAARGSTVTIWVNP